MPKPPQYWFAAKRYGWGWGLPTAGPGWLALLLYVVLLAAGAPWLLRGFGVRAIAAYVAYALGLSVLLFIVCWLKGEPPHWRWGEPRKGPVP